MKHIFYATTYTIIGLFIGILFTPTPVGTPLLTGDIETERNKKLKVLADNIYLQQRLGDELVIDLSLGTSEEWQEAGMAKMKELGVSERDLLRAGSINKALRVKAEKLSQACSKL